MFHIFSSWAVSKADSSSTWIRDLKPLLHFLIFGEFFLSWTWYRLDHDPSDMRLRCFHCVCYHRTFHPMWMAMFLGNLGLQLSWHSGRWWLHHGLLSFGRTRCWYEVVFLVHCFQKRVSKNAILSFETVWWSNPFLYKGVMMAVAREKHSFQFPMSIDTAVLGRKTSIGLR